jgi:hypothetical protein
VTARGLECDSHLLQHKCNTGAAVQQVQAHVTHTVTAAQQDKKIHKVAAQALCCMKLRHAAEHVAAEHAAAELPGSSSTTFR